MIYNQQIGTTTQCGSMNLTTGDVFAVLAVLIALSAYLAVVRQRMYDRISREVNNTRKADETLHAAQKAINMARTVQSQAALESAQEALNRAVQAQIDQASRVQIVLTQVLIAINRATEGVTEAQNHATDSLNSRHDAQRQQAQAQLALTQASPDLTQAIDHQRNVIDSLRNAQRQQAQAQLALDEVPGFLAMAQEELEQAEVKKTLFFKHYLNVITVGDFLLVISTICYLVAWLLKSNVLGQSQLKNLGSLIPLKTGAENWLVLGTFTFLIGLLLIISLHVYEWCRALGLLRVLRAEGRKFCRGYLFAAIPFFVAILVMMYVIVFFFK
jgi:hypothetical protein